jgi:translation initiation factor 4E
MEYLSIDFRLKNSWKIWYHKQDEQVWDESSYLPIYEFSTIREFYAVMNSFVYLPKFINGYYFIMRDGIKPIWEDDRNKNGGCFSIKVAKENTENIFWDMFIHMLAGELFTHYNETITGISVVPKKYNAVIKIWNNNSNICSSHLLNKRLSHIPSTDITYRSHLKNTNFGKDSA